MTKIKAWFYAISLIIVFILAPSSMPAQQLEGQVLLKLGGPDWESIGAPPVIIYFKAGKALAKLVTGFVNENLYIDEAQGTMTVVDPKKKTGKEFSLSAITGPLQEDQPPLAEPVRTEKEKRIGGWLCTLYQDSLPDKRAVIDIWATSQLPKNMRETFATLCQRVWYGFTGDRRFAALKDMFLKRDLFPVQIGARKKDEAEPASMIQFLWFDDVKLSDSTFTIPPEITVTRAK